ncbi:MAG TPA: MauE/DoxX family redox-associated membrane protein [Thermoleophilia bacterium]
MIDFASALLRCAISALLFFSFAGKILAGPNLNIAHIANYRVLPRVAVPLAARVLPALEFSLGMGLLLGLDLGLVFRMSAALFLIFAFAMTQALIRGIVTQCGCYGTLHSATVSWKLAFRNMLIAGLLWWLSTQIQEPSVGGPVPIGDWAFAPAFILALIAGDAMAFFKVKRARTQTRRGPHRLNVLSNHNVKE